MNTILIDNIVINQLNNGVISFKKYRTSRRGTLPKYTFGSRVRDNYIISSLISGTMTFDDVLNTGAIVENDVIVEDVTI
jgi:hypothetical protein